MAVAEVPGDAGQRALVGAGDFQQPLGRGLDGDDAAVLEPNAVAGAQHGRLGEIEQERQAAAASRGRCGGACAGRSRDARRRPACRAICRPARSWWLSASVSHHSCQSGNADWRPTCSHVPRSAIARPRGGPCQVRTVKGASRSIPADVDVIAAAEYVPSTLLVSDLLPSTCDAPRTAVMRTTVDGLVMPSSLRDTSTGRHAMFDSVSDARRSSVCRHQLRVASLGCEMQDVRARGNDAFAVLDEFQSRCRGPAVQDGHLMPGSGGLPELMNRPWYPHKGHSPGSPPRAALSALRR